MILRLILRLKDTLAVIDSIQHIKSIRFGKYTWGKYNKNIWNYSQNNKMNKVCNFLIFERHMIIFQFINLHNLAE